MFAVKKGSGMGLSLSCALSNCTYWYLTERNFLENPSVRRKFAIYGVFRFCDDALILTSAQGKIEAGGVARKKPVNPFTTFANFFTRLKKNMVV